ncbi:MAG: hypothetical protein M3169_06125 [Candidatus Eremiobacteraeota bacterium]|nr:hypothetical protein [Candidatus Eremiobacteraeota bacterium]
MTARAPTSGKPEQPIPPCDAGRSSGDGHATPIAQRDVEIRLSVLRDRLAFIDHAIDEELGKPWYGRKRNLLYFLYVERRTYAFAVDELEAVLGLTPASRP